MKLVIGSEECHDKSRNDKCSNFMQSVYTHLEDYSLGLPLYRFPPFQKFLANHILYMDMIDLTFQP